MNPENIYPRTNDHETVYLKNVIKNPNILVGDFTMYNDFVYDPRQFEKNTIRSTMTNLSSENFVPSPAEQSFCLLVPIIRKCRYLHFHFLSFLRNGDWMSKT